MGQVAGIATTNTIRKALWPLVFRCQNCRRLVASIRVVHAVYPSRPLHQQKPSGASLVVARDSEHIECGFVDGLCATASHFFRCETYDESAAPVEAQIVSAQHLPVPLSAGDVWCLERDSNSHAPLGTPDLESGASAKIPPPRQWWCPKRDSNSHVLRHRVLNPARLPKFRHWGAVRRCGQFHHTHDASRNQPVVRLLAALGRALANLKPIAYPSFRTE